jgi:hypothetical protein
MRAFLSDIWSHRGFRYTFIVGLSLAALVTCFYGVLNWSGEKRWQRVKAKLEAEGETFDFYALYPLPIPDDQNFCAIDALNGIRMPEGPTPEAIAAQKKREEIKKQTAFLRFSLFAAINFDAFTEGRGPDYSAILEVLKVEKALPLSGDPMTWAEVKTALETEAPILSVLGTAAKHRLKADFLPRPTRAELPEMLMNQTNPHFDLTHNLADLISFHCIVCLEAEDHEAALHSALALARLSQGSNNNRTVNANLTGLCLQSEFHQLVWLMLHSRRFDDASLALLQKELQMTNSVNATLACFRSEMAMDVASIEYLERHSQDRWDTIYPVIAEDSMSIRSAYGPALSKFIPAGFIEHNKASTAELEWKLIIKPLSKKGLKNVRSDIVLLESFLDSTSLWFNPDTILARWPLSVFSHPLCWSALNEDQRRQAILACALERHFLRHRSYPKSLQSLDAQFRAGNDLLDVNDEPMHYELIPGGRFRLWSPGPDSRDDGGKFALELGSLTLMGLYTDRYRGDWVWRYDPAVKVP